MKSFKQFLTEATNLKLVKVTEDIPSADDFDDELTWYNFESAIRITKKANFKWYENAYGDKKDGMSYKLKNLIKNRLLETGKPNSYNKGHDWYTINLYSLAEIRAAVAMSPIIAVVECGGGSGSTSWNNEFIVVKPEDVDTLEEILNQ